MDIAAEHDGDHGLKKHRTPIAPALREVHDIGPDGGPDQEVDDAADANGTRIRHFQTLLLYATIA